LRPWGRDRQAAGGRTKRASGIKARALEESRLNRRASRPVPLSRNKRRHPDRLNPPLQRSQPKVCPNCGLQSQTASDRCPSCGKKYKQKKPGGCLRTIGIATLALVALIVAIAVFSRGDEDEPSGNGGETAQAEEPEQSNRATDDNEPHVGPRESVIVDTLEWRVVSARQAPSILSQFTRERADGVYVIANLRVHNGKDKSVTINTDIVTLEVGGAEYKYDSEGTTALQLGGEETFLLKDLGPD